MKEQNAKDNTVINNKNLEVKKDIPKKTNNIGTVIKGNLNLRVAPNINSSIIKVLTNGSKVLIISSVDNDFYKVNANGIEGYCMKKFIGKVK